MGIRLDLYSGLVQNVIVALICFCCPGMFNALNGLGGSGQLDVSIASDSNVALYTTFTIFGLLGGTINNYIGPQLTIFLGSLTYVGYGIGLLLYNYYKIRWIVVFFGALLGFGAGLLWAAQGALMMSYPTSNEKGKYISIFWMIFNLGGMIGGLICFIINFNNQENGVNNSTYIAFISIMILGSLLCLLITSPAKVVRSDHSRLIQPNQIQLKTELLGILNTFRQWKMIFLIPIFIYSNFFYTYQFNAYNSKLFTIRTRSLNNCFYWGSQMLGSYLLSKLLDNTKKSKKMNAQLSILLITITMSLIWGVSLWIELTKSNNLIDFLDYAYIFPFSLYLAFGLSDALIQTWCYWIMGALTDDPLELSRYSGFYKTFQSIGGAIAWSLDSFKISSLNQLIINWSMFSFCAILAIVVSCYVKGKWNIEKKDKDFDLDNYLIFGDNTLF